MVESPTRVAVVSGAGSGIGQATGERLLEGGWTVVLADLAAEQVHARFGGDASDRMIWETDISSGTQVASLFAATSDRFGRLDAVANVAGVTLASDTRVEDVPDDVFDRVHAVNMKGCFLMCKHAIPHLRASGGGAIVNVGSVASLRGGGGTAYVSSKAGIAGLTRAIAVHYAAENIRCNTVAPGPTHTPMLEISRRKPTAVDRRSDGVLNGDAEPQEIAAVIEFLLSERGRFVTGATGAIDGGVTQH